MQEMEMSQPTSSNKNLLMIGGLVALVAVIGIGVVVARGGNSDTQMENTPSPEAATDVMMQAETMETTEAAPEAMMESESEVRTINLEAGSFYYKPDVIRVKKGETVRLVMNSVDMMHDFNIEELGVKLPITRAGETNTVEFTANEIGSFEYYCSVGNHRAQGQTGTLIVEE
ncbi:MAG TPA: cupredoxin domain-containing protein [Patescibacteria group bacterium]